jgi:methionine--tRNA ligase beta chain
MHFSDRFLTEAEPWKLKGDDEARRVAVVRTALEAIYAFTHFLAPVIPMAAQSIFQKLSTGPKSTHNLRDDFYNLVPGTVVTVGEILFQKLEVPLPPVPADIATATAGAPAAPGAAGAAKAGGGGGAKGPKAAKAAAAAAEDEEAAHEIDFTKIDLRVGRITRVWNHETADRLYCEEIDVGAEAGGVRQVVSGLRAYYSLEDLQDRLVVVVCNLKESKFQGAMSYGMVLAAKSADGSLVELLQVPEGSAVGERIGLEGYFGAVPPALTAARTKKLKTWEAVAPSLQLSETGVACWKQLPLTTSAGQCRAPTQVSLPIS